MTGESEVEGPDANGGRIGDVVARLVAGTLILAVISHLALSEVPWMAVFLIGAAMLTGSYLRSGLIPIIGPVDEGLKHIIGPVLYWTGVVSFLALGALAVAGAARG